MILTGRTEFAKRLTLAALSLLVATVVWVSSPATGTVVHTLLDDDTTALPFDSFVKVSISTMYGQPVCDDTVDPIDCNIHLEFEFEGGGSGVVIEPGLVLTAAHVCQSSLDQYEKVGSVDHDGDMIIASNSSIVDYHGDQHDMEIVTMYDRWDLCLIKSESLRAPSVPLAEHMPQRGERIYNIAAPLDTFEPTAVPLFDGFYIGLDGDYGAMLMSDMTIQPGSSGSPLFNGKGELVGIVFAHHRVIEAYGLGVPLPEVKIFLAVGKTLIR